MGLRRTYRKLVCRYAASLPFHGLTVPLKRAGMTEDLAGFIFLGTYEAPEIAGVKAVVRPDDRVLELGAGLGIVTALIARAASKGQVVAYEANPDIVPATAAFLSDHGIRNVDLRLGVLVTDAADGSEGAPRTRPFHLAASFEEGSLLAGRSSGRTVDVPAHALAEVMSTFRPTVLVCDIEGAEAFLIPATDASSLRAAVIELHPARLNRAEIASVYAAMARHGLYPEIANSARTVVTFTKV